MRKLDEKEFPGVLNTTVFIFLFLEESLLFKSLFEKTRGLVIDVVVEVDQCVQNIVHEKG
jgi:hypothetical protein